MKDLKEVTERFELLKRIEELEAEVERLRFLEQVYPESVKKRVALGERIKELEAFVKHDYMSMVNHHEDIQKLKDKLKKSLQECDHCGALMPPKKNTHKKSSGP